MASYTDSPIQFAPYVETVPVEDMVKVGMLKQEQYNQGVQKIQGWIDEIGALPVIRDVDKNYLQGKMNSLETELKRLSGADFSKQQLVNSVGGLTSSISKDSHIRAAVQSATNAQNELTFMEEARKKGELAPENEYDYLQKYSSYVNSTDLGRKFSDKYTPYTDVNKKMMEVLKAIHPNELIKDIPWVTKTDPVTGAQVPDYDKLARVMVTKGVEGIPAGQIQNAIRASLSPADFNQLAISARYQLMEYTPDQLVSRSTQVYNEKKAYYQQTLKDAVESLASVKGDAKKTAIINNNIEDIKKLLGLSSDKSLGTLEQDYNEEVQSILEDPDKAKATFFTNQAISQFANAFAWKKEKEEYKESPFEKLRLADREYNLKIAEFNEKVKQNEIDNIREEAKLEVDRFKAGMPTSGGVAGGGRNNLTSLVGAGTEDLSSPQEAMAEDAAAYLNLAEGAITKLGAYFPGGVKEAERKIEEYRFGNNGKGNPSALPPNLRNLAETYIKNFGMSSAINAKIKEATLQAEKAIPTQNLQFNYNGQKLTFTADELAAFDKKATVTQEYTPAATPGTQGSYTPVKNWDYSKLTDKEKILKDWLPRKGTEINREWVDYKNRSRQTFIDREKEKNRILAPLAQEWIGNLESVPTNTSEGQQAWVKRTANILAAMQEDKGSRVAGAGYDKLNEWLADEKNYKSITFHHFNRGLNNELWIRNGTEVAKIKLSPDEAVQLPFANNVDADILSAQQRIRLGGGKSTKISSAFIQSGANAFMRSDFKNLRTSAMVMANIEPDPVTNQVYLSIEVPVEGLGMTTFMLPKPLNIKEAKTFVATANDDQLFYAIGQAIQSSGQDPKLLEAVRQSFK